MGASEVQKLLDGYIDTGSSAQVSLESRVTTLQKTEQFQKVLDLGCGDGSSFDLFKSLDEDIDWTGLDIEGSPEVNRRTRKDCNFFVFDGVYIPFAENSFDLVYSNQVFEHVRHPEELLAEIYRVLRPEGYFIGSTSQLEPYHSYSIWNYTPYGFTLLLQDANFRTISLFPSIDGLTLIWRRIFGQPKFFNRWWFKDSPLNKIISLIGKISKEGPGKINAAKLLYCGQFFFVAQK